MTDDEDEISAATARLRGWLGDVAAQPTADAQPGFDDEVMRTARWQHALRGTARAIDDLAMIVTAGVRWVAGAPDQPDRRS